MLLFPRFATIYFMSALGDMAVKKIDKTDRDTKPSVITDDIFADRNFWQSSSDVQLMPEGDRRYRTTPSIKFYVVQLVGAWVHISESAERSIRHHSLSRWVTFEKAEHELRHASKFKPFVSVFISGGCWAYVGGFRIDTTKALSELVEQPFIYITSSEAFKCFKALRSPS